MEQQGYNTRLDEHLGMRRHHRGGKKHGVYHTAMKGRRNESEAMEKHYGKGKYSADKMMDR